MKVATRSESGLEVDGMIGTISKVIASDGETTNKPYRIEAYGIKAIASEPGVNMWRNAAQQAMRNQWDVRFKDLVPPSLEEVAQESNGHIVIVKDVNGVLYPKGNEPEVPKGDTIDLRFKNHNWTYEQFLGNVAFSQLKQTYTVTHYGHKVKFDSDNSLRRWKGFIAHWFNESTGTLAAIPSIADWYHSLEDTTGIELLN